MNISSTLHFWRLSGGSLWTRQSVLPGIVKTWGGSERVSSPVSEMFIVLDYWWRHMTLIEPLQSKEVHWSEPLMFIIAPQGRFWSFTSPQYYFGLLPYCTNDSEWRFPYSGDWSLMNWIWDVPNCYQRQESWPFPNHLKFWSFTCRTVLNNLINVDK